MKIADEVFDWAVVVLAERITGVLVRGGPLIPISSCDALSHADVIDNADIVMSIIELDKRKFFFARQVKPVREGLIKIDQQYQYKLSRGEVQYARQSWARWEGDKLRLLWTYFRSLCQRSRSSRSKVIDTLKKRYFEHFTDIDADDVINGSDDE